MEQEISKKKFGREELKKYFENGKIPTQVHFEYLIDSVIVKQDDGIAKDKNNGLIIAPLEASSRLITFYKEMDLLEPFFYVDRDNYQSSSLKFTSAVHHLDKKNLDEASTFMHQDGKLGIGKRCSEDLKTEIKGFIGAEGRKGTYKSGTVEANGGWHKIVEGLNNCQGFEIMARTGKKGSGKFSIMHAIALSAFGKSKGKIRKTTSYFGFFWNKLDLRWGGDTHNYWLEIRTKRNYGTGVNIYYNVSKLWDDELFLPQEEFYKK